MAICKKCGKSTPVLIPKKGMGVCPECAIGFVVEQENRENAIIKALKDHPDIHLRPVQINEVLMKQNLKVASSTLYSALKRLAKQGRIRRDDSQYYVED